MNKYIFIGCMLSLLIFNYCGLYCQDKKPLFDSLLVKDFGEQCSIVRNNAIYPYYNTRGLYSFTQVTLISKQNNIYVQFYEIPITSIDSHYIEDFVRSALGLSCSNIVSKNEYFQSFASDDYYYLIVPSCESVCSSKYSWCYTFKLEFMEFLKRNNLSTNKY